MEQFLIPIVFVGIVAMVVNVALTPLVSRLALRYGFVDQPDRQRKLHRRPVALGGGLAILICLCGTLVLIAACDSSLRDLMTSESLRVVGLVLASCLIVLLGLIDDRFGLRGRHKLLGQLVVAALLVGFGYVIPGVRLFGIPVELGVLSIPISIGWLLLATNALNLIDGIDGLASTVGIILSVSLSCLAFLNGHYLEALLLSTMAGSIVGFLRYNFPPARIFLGDAGSMLIGLWLGATSIHAALKGPAIVGLAAPLAVWTVPMLDTFAAIIRRKLTGRSIYTTDRGHLHHCLNQISGSTWRTLYLIVLACSATCIGALTSVSMKSDVFALISAASVIGVLIATRSFGYGEFQLLTGKLVHLVRSLVPFRANQASAAQQTVRLQGSRPWEQFWISLLEFTEEFNLTRLSLDVNIPVCHENYHVSWSKAEDTDPLPQWETKIPLCHGDRLLGRLLIGGAHDGYSVCRLMARLLDLLQSFETQFQDEIASGLNAETVLHDRIDRADDVHSSPTRKSSGAADPGSEFLIAR